AIWETTRLVLSPLVEAMNTSASSMPASVSASISSAVPIVKRPPASSQPWPCPPPRPPPARPRPGVERLVRDRALVDRGDGVARTQSGGGHGRSDPAGTD